MDDLKLQIQEELASITDALKDLLGRPSRWNGELELSDESAAFGKARWNGSIVLNRELAQSEVRWRTEIHELLHTFSAGLTVNDYMDFPGWEEGVVEQLQRSLRPEILTHMSVNVPDTTFAAVEANHEYNRYIDALNRLSNALNRPATVFYQELLAVSLKDRPKVIIEQGRQLPTSPFRDFQREFAFAFSVLRGD